MKTVINDLSFKYMFSSKEEAVQAVHTWLDLCNELTSKKVRRVQEIYGNSLDVLTEIAPNYKLIQLVQEFRDREDRSRLLGILTNSISYDIELEDLIYIDDRPAEAATFVKSDGMLISLCSKPFWENPKLEGKQGDGTVLIDNVSKKEHIMFHSEKLGIRYYEANKKHGKKPYIRSGGMIASEMDLSEEIAQKVLDEAVEISGHLYGVNEGKFYEFKKTEKNTYHGYNNAALSKEMQQKIIELWK